MRRSSMSKALVRRETISGYLFLLPSLIFFVGFVVYPMIMCVYTSFFDATMGKDRQDIFIGLQNYKDLFKDPAFLKALKNTLVIVIVSVPVTCAFSLWVSSAIYKMRGPIRSAFRCIFYLPVVTGSVAVTVVWKWMYNNYYGIFNYIGKGLGIIEKNINWLGDERFALGCIILILLTTSVGQPIVLYVSALGNVDNSLVEAAQVDGANDLHHPVYPGHHHHQLLPVLRSDTIAYLRRAKPQYGHHHVLHLLPGVQAVPLRLRQRHGRDPGHHHRHLLRRPVQAGQGGHQLLRRWGYE